MTEGRVCGKLSGLAYLDGIGAGAGAGAGATLGQQEAANKEATAAITRSLTIFIIVVGGVVFL